MEPPAAGSLGPRLAGRLTAELILRSPQYMSCVHLYHLDLRGALVFWHVLTMQCSLYSIHRCNSRNVDIGTQIVAVKNRKVLAAVLVHV